MGYWRTIHNALGAKKYVIGGTAVTVSAIYFLARDWLVSKGITWLPEIHPSVGIVLIFLLLLAIFFVQRLKFLEDKLVPKFAISDPIAYTDPKNTSGKASLRTFKVNISNQSAEIVKGCELKLLKMENVDGVLSKEAGRQFKQSLQDWKPNVAPYSKSFDIKPDDSVDVDLVRYKEEQRPSSVTMCYAIDVKTDTKVYVNVPLESCPHIMTVRAVAENCSTPVDRDFQFYVTDTGLLGVGPA